MAGIASPSSIQRSEPVRKKIPNPIDKHVGERLRSRRRMISMSQEKLGEKLGITFQQIQKYENGTNRMGASRLQQTASALGVSIAFFFEGVQGINPVTGDDMAAELVNTLELLNTLQKGDGMALAKAFTRISDPTIRRRIVQLVEALGA